MSKKAIVAMSGGVDSSVAAYLSKSQGFECMGATMKLFANEDIGISREKSCCSLDDVEDARSVAYRLGMPYNVFNFSDNFKENVIDRFIKAYETGFTPNPCIDCNRYLKFDKMYRRAKELEYDYIVTGHYARIEKDKKTGRYLLKKAVDKNKDQSYVLYSLTQDQLAHTLFPLGELTKRQVREIAESQGFLNASKKESQDICFVPDGDYAGFIERTTGKTYPCGKFIDTKGNVLGEHKGIIRYTIGQRKGLGLALPAPMYVKEKDLVNNTVILSYEDEIFSSELTASDFNWIAFEKPDDPFRCTVKTRYRAKEAPAEVFCEDKKVKIVFDEPQRAITKGQAAVLYDGDTVIGGGTIE